MSKVIPDNAPDNLVVKVAPGVFHSVIGFDDDGAPVVGGYPDDYATPPQLVVYDPAAALGAPA